VPRRLTQVERSEDTRRRLLEAARRVFVQRGFHAATLEQVADAAGFTKGAVYSQFESKADLFFALLEKRVEQRLEEIRSAGAAASSPEELASIMGRQWLRGARADMGWQLLAVEFRVHVARNPELRARYVSIHARLRDAIGEALAAEFRGAGLEPPISPADMARAALAIGQGGLLGHLAEGEAFPADLMDRVGVAFMRSLVTESQQKRQSRARRSARPPRARRKEEVA
jgi:AcrR family transcriptional regulator